MKVLQVASGLHDWGGIERYVVYLASGLANRGHEVLVTCPPGSPLDQRIETAKQKISVSRKIEPRAAAAYLRLFRGRRFDVVHAHFNPDFITPMWAARVTRQPLTVLTRHVALPWSARKVRLYSRFFDHVIPVSEAVKQKLLLSGIPERKMTVAKAGCPAVAPSRSIEEQRAALGIDTQCFSAGYFGRLTVEKGIDVLLDAAEQMPAGADVRVFGRGPLQGLVEASAALHPERVRYHGFREDVTDCMSAVDAVVVSSTWEEAFPYSALEAMSAGKPVVASRVGGMPEIVSEGETGLLFDNRDAAGLAEAVGVMAANRELAVSMGEKGRTLHRAEYTVERMAERIEAVYVAVG